MAFHLPVWHGICYIHSWTGARAGDPGAPTEHLPALCQDLGCRWTSPALSRTRCKCSDLWCGGDSQRVLLYQMLQGLGDPQSPLQPFVPMEKPSRASRSCSLPSPRHPEPRQDSGSSANSWWLCCAERLLNTRSAGDRQTNSDGHHGNCSDKSFLLWAGLALLYLSQWNEAIEPWGSKCQP